MKKRVFAAFCAALVLFGLLSWSGGSARADWDDGLILIAINDQLLPLSADVMPITINGTYYVPYTLFDANLNGGYNVGSIYSGGQKVVNGTLVFTLYSGGTLGTRNLNFDLSTGSSYDYFPDGEEQAPRAVIRDGRIYVSAEETCDYFRGEGAFPEYYKTLTTYGYPLIRLRGRDSQLDDRTFVSSLYSGYILYVLNTYYRTLNPQSTQPPDLPPISSPSVDPSGQVPGDGRKVRTYLAVDCGAGGDTAAVLDQLKDEGRAALLLFPADGLAEQDDLIRRAVGSGHAIGLTTDAPTAEAALEELAAANGLLEHIALTHTAIALSTAGDDAVTAGLEAAGWLCWQGNLDGTDMTPSDVLRTLEARQSTTRVTLDNRDSGVRSLDRLLRTLREEPYDYRLAVETEF